MNPGSSFVFTWYMSNAALKLVLLIYHENREPVSTRLGTSPINKKNNKKIQKWKILILYLQYMSTALLFGYQYIKWFIMLIYTVDHCVLHYTASHWQNPHYNEIFLWSMSIVHTFSNVHGTHLLCINALLVQIPIRKLSRSAK